MRSDEVSAKVRRGQTSILPSYYGHSANVQEKSSVHVTDVSRWNMAIVHWHVCEQYIYQGTTEEHTVVCVRALVCKGFNLQAHHRSSDTCSYVHKDIAIIYPKGRIGKDWVCVGGRQTSGSLPIISIDTWHTLTQQMSHRMNLHDMLYQACHMLLWNNVTLWSFCCIDTDIFIGESSPHHL